MLTLSPILSPAISSILIDIINRTLTTQGDAEEEYKATASNSAWVLGVCMQALSKREASEWSDVDLASWTRTCVNNWPWSHEVLGGIYALSQAKYV